MDSIEPTEPNLPKVQVRNCEEFVKAGYLAYQVSGIDGTMEVLQNFVGKRPEKPFSTQET